MKITDLTSLRAQNAALQTAIAAAIAPFGLTLERQAGVINPADGKLKLTLTTGFLPEGIENAADLAKANWSKRAPLLGLPADAYGKTVMLGGNAFVLHAVDVSRPKNNVTVKRASDGKTFLTTAATVKFQLA